jgi:hypothetical protein
MKWIAGIGIMLYGVWLFSFLPPSREIPEWGKEERTWVKERMKYHGISGCITEGKESYFYRDGKKCKL